MSTPSLEEQLIQELTKLTSEQMQYLLDVARHMQKAPLQPGIPGEVLIAHMDAFSFSPGAVDEMLKLIEENSEKVDWDGWQ